MKSNGDKCYLIVSTNDTAQIQIGEYLIKSSTNEKLLGVNIDSKLLIVMLATYAIKQIRS